MVDNRHDDVRPARARWRKQLWVPVIAGVLVVLLMVAVVAIRSPRSGVAAGSVDTTADAATALNQAADVLAGQPSAPLPTPRADQWLYIKRVTRRVVEGTDTWETWERLDGSASANRHPGEDIQVMNAPSDGNILYSNLLGLYDLYRKLPEEPDAVLSATHDLNNAHRRQLVDAAGCPTREACDAIVDESWLSEWMAFTTLDHLLGAGAPPPNLQARLYRALAKVPGIENDGIVKDAAGKDALAIAWDQERTGKSWFTERQQVLIDPDTAKFRGIRALDYDLITDDHELTASTVLSAGIVDKAGEVPQTLAGENGD